MRKITSLAAIIALAGPAYAADLPLKAPAMAPVEPIAPSWTGFYIGGHLGAAWPSDSGMTFNDPNTPTVIALAPHSFTSGSDARFLGGVHGGYNWQFDPRWVLGVEADVSWTDVKANATVSPLQTNGGLTFLQPSSLTMSENIRWLASVRGRLGFVAWTNTLLYATGGVAWQNVDYNGAVALPGTPTASTSFSKTNVGFVVGGGLEWQVVSHVMLRAEYLYYGFDQNQRGTAITVAEPAPLNFGWSNSNIQVVRVGASYKF